METKPDSIQKDIQKPLFRKINRFFMHTYYACFHAPYIPDTECNIRCLDLSYCTYFSPFFDPLDISDLYDSDKVEAMNCV